MKAVRCGKVDVMKALMEAGAAFNKEVCIFLTHPIFPPRILVVSKPKPPSNCYDPTRVSFEVFINILFGFLLINFSKLSQYKQGETLLTFAAKMGHVQVVEALIDRGAEVDKPDGIVNIMEFS